jgi:hypothetical protein
MYTIKLTRGTTWGAPVIAVHCVERTVHVVEVERRAQALLMGARQTCQRSQPTDYHILDPHGRCVRSSVTAASVKSSASGGGRTCWR